MSLHYLITYASLSCTVQWTKKMRWEKLKMNQKLPCIPFTGTEGNQIFSLLNLWNFIADALVSTMMYPTSCLGRPVPLIQLNIRWKLESDVQLLFFSNIGSVDTFSWNLDELWCHCPKYIFCAHVVPTAKLFLCFSSWVLFGFILLVPILSLQFRTFPGVN